MSADFLLAVALALQQPTEFVLAHPVIFLYGVHSDRFRGPFLVQPIRDRLLDPLVGAVITEKDDVAEAGGLEAARGIFEDLLEGLLRDGDRAGKPHMSRRRFESAI